MPLSRLGGSHAPCRQGSVPLTDVVQRGDGGEAVSCSGPHALPCPSQPWMLICLSPLPADPLSCISLPGLAADKCLSSWGHWGRGREQEMENEPNPLQGTLWASDGVMQAEEIAGDSRRPRHGQKGQGARPGSPRGGQATLEWGVDKPCFSPGARSDWFLLHFDPGPEQHVRGVPGGEQLSPLHHLPDLRPREGGRSHPGGHPPGL